MLTKRKSRGLIFRYNRFAKLCLIVGIAKLYGRFVWSGSSFKGRNFSWDAPRLNIFNLTLMS